MVSNFEVAFRVNVRLGASGPSDRVASIVPGLVLFQGGGQKSWPLIRASALSSGQGGIW